MFDPIAERLIATGIMFYCALSALRQYMAQVWSDSREGAKLRLQFKQAGVPTAWDAFWEKFHKKKEEAKK